MSVASPRVGIQDHSLYCLLHKGLDVSTYGDSSGTKFCRLFFSSIYSPLFHYNYIGSIPHFAFAHPSDLLLLPFSHYVLHHFTPGVTDLICVRLRFYPRMYIVSHLSITLHMNKIPISYIQWTMSSVQRV